MEQRYQILSFSLLLALVLAIVPPETFHRHQHASTICLDSSKHVETKHFSCELGDFVLPLFHRTQFDFHFEVNHIALLHLFPKVKIDLKQHFSLPFYRGPPNFLS